MQNASQEIGVFLHFCFSVFASFLAMTLCVLVFARNEAISRAKSINQSRFSSNRFE